MASLNSWDIRNRVVAFSALLLIGVCLSPLLSLLFSVDFSTTFLSRLDHTLISIYGRSLSLSLLTALLAMAIGTALAYLLVRTNVLARHVMLLLFCIPLFIPSYIHALTWSRMLGKTGSLDAILPNLSATLTVDGWWGSAWVLTLSYYPIVLMTVTAALMRWDQRYQDAALLCGRPLKALLFIQFRYLRLHLLLGGLLVFMLSFADFGVADFFQVHVYATEIFIQLTAYLDMPGAIAVSLPLIAISLLMLGFLVYLGRHVYLFSSDGRQKVSIPHDLGLYKTIITIIMVLLLTILVLLPLGHLIYLSGGVANMVRAFSMIWEDALTGALVAALAAIFAVLLSLFSMYGCHRQIKPAGGYLRFFPLMMLSLPASLTALGMILLWNQPGWQDWFYVSGGVLILGLSTRWLPVATELMIMGWAQTSVAQEHAAYTTGVDWFRTFHSILIPQMMPVIRIALLLVFIFSFNDLALMTLLTPAGLSTLPTRIFSTVHYGPDYLVAAVCLWQVIFLMLPLVWLYIDARTIIKKKTQHVAA